MNTRGMGRCEERGFDSVVCPKPRRVGLFNSSAHDRWPTNSCYQTEMADSIAGTELLDIILTKGGYGAERDNNYQQVAASPPFFCGSPPSRASNPVIQDAQFNNEKQQQQLLPPPPPPSPSSSSRIAAAGAGGGGCVRMMKFGHMPAAVRIEGFDCLSRDHRGRNRSISAVA